MGDRRGMWRAPGNCDINVYDLIHSRRDTIGVTKDSPVNRAVAARDDHRGLRGGVQGTLQRLGHIARDDTSDQQAVGVTRRRHQSNAVTCGVIRRRKGRCNLEFTAIARAGIDMTQLK